MDKKPELRRRILQVLSATYSTGTPDSAISDALKQVYLKPTKDDLEAELQYLDGKRFVELDEDRERGMLVARLTASGLDVLEGAVQDVGVEPPPEGQFSTLHITRDIRRGILSIAAQYNGWVRDRDFKNEFINLGTYENILIETVRMHLWYLHLKGYVSLKPVEMLAGFHYYVRITSLGHDLNDRRITDPGVTS